LILQIRNFILKILNLRGFLGIALFKHCNLLIGLGHNLLKVDGLLGLHVLMAVRGNSSVYLVDQLLYLGVS